MRVKRGRGGRGPHLILGGSAESREFPPGGKCFLRGEMRMYETGQKGNTDWLPVGFPVDQQSLLFVKTKHLVLAVRMKDNDVSKSVGSSTCDVCSLEKSYALAKSS